MEVTFSAPRRLEDGEELEGFRCGDQLVDSWAAEHAPHAKRRGTAVVYASYSAGIPAGFYSLSSHSVRRDSVRGGWLRRNVPCDIPVVLMGMLGVDERFKGRGLGEALLRDAVMRASAAAESVGAKALVVDPSSDSAEAFYSKYGFERMEGSLRMFVRL